MIVLRMIAKITVSGGIRLELTPRKANLKCAAKPRPIADRGNRTRVIFDDAMRDAQAQSSALPRLFRRKERVEDMVQGFFVHSAAVVFNADDD